MGLWYFLLKPTKKFSLQNGEKIEGRKWSCLIDKNTHVLSLSFFPCLFFVLGTLPHYYCYYYYYYYYYYFDFLGKGWHVASFLNFFPFFFSFLPWRLPFFWGGWGCDSCFLLLFLFVCLFVKVDMIFFFFWIWFLFFNKLRWLFLFIYHVFGFNWISFFNKSIYVNLYKFTFFIIPFFSLSTKQKREKLKKISILLLFHHFTIFYPPIFLPF